jgi:hypothetical protein
LDQGQTRIARPWCGIGRVTGDGTNADEGRREGTVVEKRRYQLPCGDLTWEVDVFSGENLGLVIAEIELRHEDQHIDLLPWIGSEDRRRACASPAGKNARRDA